MVDAFVNDAVVTTTDERAAFELTAITPSVTVVGDPTDVTVDGLRGVAATEDVELGLTNEALATTVVEEGNG